METKRSLAALLRQWLTHAEGTWTGTGEPEDAIRRLCKRTHAALADAGKKRRHA